MNKPIKGVPGDELKGIQEVARELGVTHRTLRFYEDKGLIAPQRIGTTRVYSKREGLRQQRRAIEETIRELDEIAREAEAYLARVS